MILNRWPLLFIILFIILSLKNSNVIRFHNIFVIVLRIIWMWVLVCVRKLANIKLQFSHLSSHPLPYSIPRLSYPFSYLFTEQANKENSQRLFFSFFAFCSGSYFIFFVRLFGFLFVSLACVGFCFCFGFGFILFCCCCCLSKRRRAIELFHHHIYFVKLNKTLRPTLL